MKVKRIASFITVVAVAAVGFTCVFAAACKKKDEHEHTYTSSVTKEATCTEKGEKTYTCTDCGDTYTEAIDELGHDYQSKTTTASCTEAGTTYEECSRCHDVQNLTTSGEALGHVLTGTYGTSGWTYTCSRCSGDIDIANDPIESLTLVATSGSEFSSANSWSADSDVEAVIDLTAAITISSSSDFKLTKNVVVEKNATIGVASSLTLDLNGRTIEKADETDGIGAVQVGSADNQYGSLIIKDSSAQNVGEVSGMYAVTVFGATSSSSSSSLTVQAGNITSENGLAISTNYNYSNVTISVEGGKISSANGTAIYLPGGTLTVSGGEISGDTGIEIRSGTLTVTGGTISTTAETEETPDGSSGGTSASGYAIAETHTSSYGDVASIKISGGTVNGAMYSAASAISVTGGTFSVNPSSFVASGYSATQSGSSWIITASSD